MNQRNEMSLVKSQTLAELQTLKKSRLGMALGSTVKVYVLRRTSVRASSPKALEIEDVCWGHSRVFLLHGAILPRWVTVVEGNFKFKEAIHMKEGRAALMGSRRAVAGTAGQGHRFLSLTDNMRSLLAFDRGRSCSYDQLCLCRRAAALCIGR